MNYEFSKIEAKWHKYWEEHDTFHTDETTIMQLDEFITKVRNEIATRVR